MLVFYGAQHTHIHTLIHSRTRAHTRMHHVCIYIYVVARCRTVPLLFTHGSVSWRSRVPFLPHRFTLCLGSAFSLKPWRPSPNPYKLKTTWSLKVSLNLPLSLNVADTRRIVGDLPRLRSFFSSSRAGGGGDDRVASVTHLERSLFPPAGGSRIVRD